MKKCFYALTAALLALTSCSSQEEPVMEAEGGEVTTVTLSVALPGEPKSRAVTEDGYTKFGMGDFIKKLEYAIYDKNDNLVISSFSKNAVEAELDEKDHGHFTLNDIRLITNHTYTIYCWATAENSPYTFHAPEEGNAYVTINYGSENFTTNNLESETGDAFFGKRTVVIKERQTSDEDYMVTLVRPFAQFNVFANDKGLAQELYKGEKGITSVTVEIAHDKPAGTYSKLDFKSMFASEQASNVKYTISYPNGWENMVHAGPGYSDGADFYYLISCYMLTGVALPTDGLTLNGYGTAQELVDIIITVNYGNGEFTKIERNNIPVRRGWRTNIYGDILTSQNDINYRLDYKFEGDLMQPDWDHKQTTEPNPGAEDGGDDQDDL